jgi:hypothetical protein
VMELAYFAKNKRCFLSVHMLVYALRQASLVHAYTIDYHFCI